MVTQAEIAKAVGKVFAAFQIDDYVRECVAFGRIRSGDVVPVQTYLKELGLGNVRFDSLQQSEGTMIDAQGRVRETDVADLRLKVYNFQMSLLFGEGYMRTDDFDENHMIDFCEEMREYVRQCYPLFSEILNMQEQADTFDVMDSCPYAENWHNVEAEQKFLVAIKKKQIRKGTRVETYFKESTRRSPYIERLLSYKDGKCVLINDDTQSIAYKLAMFTSFHFLGQENSLRFSLKCKAWISAHGGMM